MYYYTNLASLEKQLFLLYPYLQIFPAYLQIFPVSNVIPSRITLTFSIYCFGTGSASNLCAFDSFTAIQLRSGMLVEE